MSERIEAVDDFAVEYTDIREGIIVDYGNGKQIEIPPHSQRVYLEVWGNGFIDVLFYDEPELGEDESDRIHLMVHGFGGDTRGFLMNTQDAMAMIHGLSTAVQRAIEAGVPTKP